MSSPINVSIALVLNDKDQILITLRAKDADSFPSTWEFPGGKVEQNEAFDVALIRELKEEVNIICINPEFWFTREDKKVHLHIFWVRQLEGEVQCLEGQQAYKWVDISHLTEYAFPASNQIIIEKIQSLANVSIHKV